MSTNRKILVALGVLLALVACSALTPRKGWNPSFGPVVPHDKFPADCTLCHEGATWHKIRADFAYDHEKETGVPLRGAHAAAACLLCHNDRGPVKVFADKGCSGCHEDPHSAKLGARCTDCHSESSWRPVAAIQEHNRTRFQLIGAHAAAACFTCHPGATSGQFSGLSIACESCHAKDLPRATSPDHAALGLTSDCQRCHTTFAFKPATFNHPASFPLTAGHAGVTCNQCHTTPGVYTGLSTACASCHLPDFQRTTDPNHVAANFSTNCTQCHATTRWQGATFAHTTAFPLTSGHAGRRCSECHTTPGTYVGLSTDCVSCHLTNYQHTTNPNHAAAGFPTNCTQCHTTIRWQGASFAHPASFPLTNGHAGRSCNSCHTTPGVYTGLSTSCSACHMPDFQRTTNPNHVTAGFPTDCTGCHNTTHWQGASFVHTSRFPLTNSHSGLGCTICHTTPGVYTGLNNACSSCHLPDYQHATNPVHTPGVFSTTCTQCHDTRHWQGAQFQHTAAFPLTNGHAGRSCSVCHTTPGVYTGLNRTCVTCHMGDYQRTTNPNHAASNFPTTCTQCHNTTQWQGASFTHPPSFPLTSGHAGRACTLCHIVPGVYTGLSTTCSSCHLTDFQQTNNPNHVASGFPTNCTMCHNTTTWTNGTFNHPASFPLTSGHAGRTCTSCHTTPGVFTGLSTTCSSCHLSDYQHTTNPVHTAGAFSTTCTQCHTTVRWTGATFNHTPSFPLTAGHAGRACSLCHTTPGVYTGQSTACSSCHLDDFQHTTNPNHVNAGFPTNCTQCHNTTQWQGATFNHPASFPLTNGHAGRGCTLCHTVPGVYTGQSTACSSCHLDDYQHTTNPNHVGAGFPTNCTMCHATTTWLTSSYVHPATFPLTNAHAGRSCTACHTVPGVFTGQSTACSSCHLTDYQHATNPVHTAGAFSTTCTQCHNTVAWQGATFQHPASFPLTAGHAGRTCTQCHHVPGVYTGQSTLCSSCHLTNYQQTTNPNHTTTGYGTGCAQCHTTTTWLGAVFTHHFPITSGNHHVACIKCHLTPANQTIYTCTNCHEHAQATMASHHQGVSGYSWVSTACVHCHPNGRN